MPTGPAPGPSIDAWPRAPADTEFAMRLGVMFAPGIVVDGELVSCGRPSGRRLRRDLRKRTTVRDEPGGPW